MPSTAGRVCVSRIPARLIVVPLLNDKFNLLLSGIAASLDGRAGRAWSDSAAVGAAGIACGRALVLSLEARNCTAAGVLAEVAEAACVLASLVIVVG